MPTLLFLRAIERPNGTLLALAIVAFLAGVAFILYARSQNR